MDFGIGDLGDAVEGVVVKSVSFPCGSMSDFLPRGGQAELRDTCRPFSLFPLFDEMAHEVVGIGVEHDVSTVAQA